MAKFIITAEKEGYTREIGGVHFVDGTAETDKENIARWLEGRGGFTVEVQETEKKSKSLSQMKSEELDVYALELGIDIPPGTKVPEKKEAIQAFLDGKKED